MRYIESNSTDPYFNLALEEYVFDQLSENDSFFMLWQNENTIVIGKYQNTAEEINQAFVDENGIRVVRRLSGGGAVYHDKGNLNFTFIVDQDQLPDFNFRAFAVPIVETLKDFGIRAEFNGRNDITINGRKFCGNSQYVKRGRVLHHGCIMLDSNLTNVSDGLKVRKAKFISKNAKSVRGRVTTINSHLEKPLSMDEFKQALKRNILGDGQIEPYILAAADLAAIEKLKKEKYQTWEWNYGRAISYTMIREEKFPAGLVTVHMKAEKGHILDIKFYGDFFGNGEIGVLEQGLKGAVLDKSLERVLEELNLQYYMHGISAKELSSLIRG